jgi:putative transposase
MRHFHDLMFPDQYYHILNRAVGDEKLFRYHGNYLFFLRRFQKYILPIADIYCYCLLPNHFHFLIRIKTEDEIVTLPGFTSLRSDRIAYKLSKQFSNLFNSYSKCYNTMYDRKGTLFMRPFKRLLIKDDHYLTKIVHYIHANPVQHGYCKSIPDWYYSSYNRILSKIPGSLQKKEVLSWFGGIRPFEVFHGQTIMLKSKV